MPASVGNRTLPSASRGLKLRTQEACCSLEIVTIEAPFAAGFDAAAADPSGAPRAASAFSLEEQPAAALAESISADRKKMQRDISPAFMTSLSARATSGPRDAPSP